MANSSRHHHHTVATAGLPMQILSTMAGAAKRGVARQPESSSRLHITIYARAPSRFREEQALGCSPFVLRIASITAYSKLSIDIYYAMRLMKWQTIFSTGLLVLEPTQITQLESPTFVTTGFDAGGFDLSNVGSTAAQQAYGVQTGRILYPSDTLENLVVQHFNPPSGLDISKYTSEVEGFSTNLYCEILQLRNATQTFLPWRSIAAPYFIVNITTDSCHIKNAIVGQGADHNYYRDNNVTENYQGLINNYTCNTGGDSSALHPLNGNSSMDHRILLSMAHLQWAPHRPVFQSSATWVTKLSAVLCKPTYSIDRYSVSHTQGQGKSRMQAVKIPGTNSTLKGFGDPDLIQAVQASFKNKTFGQGGSDYVVTQVPSFFQVMKAVHNASTLEPFMDTNLLQDLGSRIFQDASASIARQNLMTSEYRIATASMTYTENRLQVKRLTVGLMATCLGLLACVSILEVFVRPWNTVSCEPRSISALSTILAASRTLRQHLISTGSATLSDLQRRFSQDKFQTVIIQLKTNSFVLEPVPDSAEKAAALKSSSPDQKVEWWRPMAVKSWFTALIIILPLCFIAILEALQHVSDSRDGIIDVTGSNVDSQILSTYLPAFVTMVLGMLYSSLDCTVSIFAPLAALRRGNVPASRSIMVSSVGGLPPFALFQSLRSRHFAQCITIIAAFVSSLLAIVVSALYSVETIVKDQPLSLQQADFFNWTHVNLAEDDEFAGSVTNLIAYENTDFPQWTFENLVLPSLTASSPKISTPGSKSVVVTVPAIRGSLNNCSAVSPKVIHVNAESAPPSCADCSNLVQLNYKMALPYTLCGFDPKNATVATWSQTYTAPNDSSMVYAGTGTALEWFSPSEDGEGSIVGDGAIFLDDPRDSVDNYFNLDNSLPSCPSFSYSLGMANAGTKQQNRNTDDDGIPWKSKQNITIMYCYQRLEQVMTNVTFNYPDFTINSTRPPIPLEETAVVITQNNTQQWFDVSVNTLMNSLRDLPVSIKGQNSINGFIQALSFGRNGVPLEQLYNNGNFSNLNDAANRLYGQYAAQAISANMRSTVPPDRTSTVYNVNQTPSTYKATLSHPTQRLRQYRGPKIALQVMLAFIAVCAMGAYIVMDTKRVVPHNPCSIVGMMSLLAESEMCKTTDIIPEGSEWKSDGELKREGVFGGLMFRIGWWGAEGDSPVKEGEKDRLFGIDVVGRGDGERR